MDQSARTYACIDLKSFYASVECADRGLDPMSTRLVVADPSRSRGTICLAVSPALRALGMPSRCRLFQVPAALHPVVAPPRMGLYIETAADIYGVYLRHIAPEDMHVYSVDEVFLDLTQYLPYYGVSARELVRGLMDEVRREKGVYATAGIGPNLFVAKAALDVEAKHDPDCIAELDEESFRQRLWFHRPITDIWGIGPNIARRLAARDIHDLAGICAAPEADLYGEFGRNAEYLIDHAWGQEPVTMAQIKAHVPRSRSLCTGQVLPRPYSFAETRTVLREMAGDLALDLVEKELSCGSLSLSVGYQEPRGRAPSRRGRPGSRASTSRRLAAPVCTPESLVPLVLELHGAVADPGRAVRRLSLSAGHLRCLGEAQLRLPLEEGGAAMELSRTVNAIRRRFGASAVVPGASLRGEATGRERHCQIGGHHA